MLSIITPLRQLVLRQHSSIQTTRNLHISAACAAARKGTREKARKKKVKVEVKKVGFIPHNQRDKKVNVQRANKHIDDSWKQVATDNVWVGIYYRWHVYTIQEAIQCHRETHHPTVYNVPDAPLIVEIELNMEGEKKTRFVDNFQRMAMVPHKFDHGDDRKILVFTKGQDEIGEARNAGATHVGGVDLIKDVTNGDLLLTDYQYIIAHPNILPELVALRGLMKRKFPNPKNETLGINLGEIVIKFKNGISYMAVRDEHQSDFGLISTSVGRLNMDAQHLEENLSSLLKDVDTMRPKREGKFITRVVLKSPPSVEQLKIDPFLYVPEVSVKTKSGRQNQMNEEELDEKETNGMEAEEQKKQAAAVN